MFFYRVVSCCIEAAESQVDIAHSGKHLSKGSCSSLHVIILKNSTCQVSMVVFCLVGTIPFLILRNFNNKWFRLA